MEKGKRKTNVRKRMSLIYEQNDIYKPMQTNISSFLKKLISALEFESLKQKEKTPRKDLDRIAHQSSYASKCKLCDLYIHTHTHNTTVSNGHIHNSQKPVMIVPITRNKIVSGYYKPTRKINKPFHFDSKYVCQSTLFFIANHITWQQCLTLAYSYSLNKQFYAGLLSAYKKLKTLTYVCVCICANGLLSFLFFIISFIKYFWYIQSMFLLSLQFTPIIF